MTKRKYKITSSIGSIWANPTNDENLKYKYKKSTAVCFSIKLSTKLQFVNNSKKGITDFNFLRSLIEDPETQCENVICEIYKVCNGTDVLEYTGVMPLRSGEWDFDRCTVTIELKPMSDIYERIINNKEETNITVSSLYPDFSYGPDVVCDYSVPGLNVAISGEMFFGAPDGMPFGLYNEYFVRIYSVGLVVCVAGVGNYTAVGNDVWVLTHYSNSNISSSPSYIYDYPISGEINSLTVTKLNVSTFQFIERQNPNSPTFFQLPFLKFHRLVHAIVLELLVKCGRDSSKQMIRSDFFDWNAVGDTPGYVASVIPKMQFDLPNINYPNGNLYTVPDSEKELYTPRIPGINYVTGQSNKLTNLMFLPKSNAKNPSASTWEQPFILDEEAIVSIQTSNKITFKDIEIILATMFNAYWFIDTDGCMRIEHESWFNTNATVYNSLSPENEILNRANKKFKFNDIILPRKEVFLFSTNRDYLNGRVDFLDNKNNEIYYDSVCETVDKKGNEQVYNVPLVTTDVACINAKNNSILDDKYDDDGIFLCVVDIGAISHTVPHGSQPYQKSLCEAVCLKETELNNASPILYENGHLQWANLIRRYLKGNRALYQGLNGSLVLDFNLNTIKTKEQTAIIKLCCGDTFNPNFAKIITSLGTGDVSEAEYDTKTNTFKIILRHD